jgi:hypothetical protein
MSEWKYAWRKPARTMRGMARHRTLLVGIGLLTLAVAAAAQVPGVPARGGVYQREMVPVKRAGFMFCRLMYTSVRNEEGGRGWSTDYPMADRNLMTRLGQFTTTLVNKYPDGDPANALVHATDPDLFSCPFLFASDAGTAGFSAKEAEALRQYLMKGGFLWADDFWGEAAIAHWLREMSIVLPEYHAQTIQSGHPLFATYYNLESLPQIPNIGAWRRSGQTSERGVASAVPTMSAIADQNGRVMVVMTHNTDIADGWEREGEDYDYFARFSPVAYAVAINVAVFSMTR